MELKTIKLKNHFYLYCAMFYNKGESIDNHELVDELSAKVVDVLAQLNFRKLEMPMHAYHYFMGLYNPDGYDDKGNIMKPSEEFLAYVQELSTLKKLEQIYKEYEPALDERLSAYEEKFSYLNKYFEDHYDFKPKNTAFYITRNWDGSGKCISTKAGIYIFVGWKVKDLNSMQILHEITHSFINECKLPIPSAIEKIMEDSPEYIKDSYGRPSSYAEDSFIRALIVYLDKVDGDTFEFSFKKYDTDMVLPEMYLKKLEQDGVKQLTKNYIDNFKL